jgi:hypothetical protein
MKKFTFKLKNGTEKVMEFDEFVRWACLIEGIDYISAACKQNNIDSSDDCWIKPLAIQNYIEERFHSMKHDLTVEATLGNI